MHYPPRSEHQWRQSDAYSMTLNYYQDNLDFFNPQMHLQRSYKGKAVGEFPLIYYLDALIWKISGPSVFVVRLINLLIAFGGLFALYRVTFEIIKDRFFAFALPLFIYSAPLFAYYSNSFLVNIDALSFLFISWYFLYKYSLTHKFVYLIPAIICVALAGLLRSTMLLGYIPIFVWFIYSYFFIIKEEYKRLIFQISLLLTPFIAVISWILFIRTYNHQNHSTYFLTTINPLWNTPNKTEIWSEISTQTMNELYPLVFRILILIILLMLIFLLKKLNKFYFFLTAFIVLELISYTLLWYQYLNDHDYYLIEFLILIPPLFITIFIFLKEKNHRLFKSGFLRIGLSVGLLILIMNCAAKTRIKYDKKAFFVTKLFLSDKEINQWSLRHWGYDETILAFESIEPHLDSIGIHKNDLVISVPDVSSNITLSLMNRRGFSFLYVDDNEIKRDMALFLKNGAKYMLIYKSEFAKSKDLKKYTHTQIGKYKNVLIYKL